MPDGGDEVDESGSEDDDDGGLTGISSLVINPGKCFSSMVYRYSIRKKNQARNKNRATFHHYCTFFFIQEGLFHVWKNMDGIMVSCKY